MEQSVRRFPSGPPPLWGAAHVAPRLTTPVSGTASLKRAGPVGATTDIGTSQVQDHLCRDLSTAAYRPIPSGTGIDFEISHVWAAS